jgi:hypothetical protein
MRLREFLRAFAIIALLLPGLVFAAPTAGACGLCDRGVPCPNMATPEPVASAHSCCGEAAVDAPAKSAPPSLGSMDCDCGRDAPPAIAAVEAPTTQANDAEASCDAVVSVAINVQTTDAACKLPATTPPHPLIFLVDCVFLT